MKQLHTFAGVSKTLVTRSYPRRTQSGRSDAWYTHAPYASIYFQIEQGASGNYYLFLNATLIDGSEWSYVFVTAADEGPCDDADDRLENDPWPPLGYVATGEVWNYVYRATVSTVFATADLTDWLDAH
jgi:hypothetical protein